MYLISTPVTLYLWLGKDLAPQKVQGSLRILNAFTQGIIGEKLEYKPGYKIAGGRVTGMCCPVILTRDTFDALIVQVARTQI